MSLLDKVANCAQLLRAVYPDQRWGQAFSNALRLLDPETSDRIHGTTADPFYNDDNLAAFIHALIPEKDA